MDPLTIMGLVKFVPDLVGLFDKKRGKDAQNIIEKVGGIAEAVTGKTGKDATAAIEADPELAYKFQIAVMADSHVQDQLNLENLKSARDMYKVNPQQAEKVAGSIMRFNIWVIFLLVAINVGSVIYLKDHAAVLAIISNFIGIVMHALLNERQSVVGFYFGSSLGSKLKSDKSGEK